ncbi:MAG: ferritin-like domain-containing protein [Bacteroidota bacterium]
MTSKKIFTLFDEVTPDNIEQVMQQAIALELATIPTYLSTYYSINRAQDQDKLYSKLHAQLSDSGLRTTEEIDALAQELKLDILVYANQSAALIMSVVIEEMLHLALSCNVKHAVCQVPPDLMDIGKVLSFPTQLDGHEPEFEIDSAKLSLDQLTTFLMIESPKPFENPNPEIQLDATVEYKTIGRLYKMIMKCIEENFPGPYNPKPQLLPPEDGKRNRPFYSQNSMNTVYYDREHNPHFGSADGSGGLLGVQDSKTANEALYRIVEQGEGSTTSQNHKPQHLLEWGPDNMPVPMKVIDGKVEFWPGDYDDDDETELAHFAKFLEAYSLGDYYTKKFNKIEGLDNFFSYFVYDVQSNPTQADYDNSGNEALALCNKLGNALFAYILLMVETCYYKDESTQYDLFMFGIHKSMIWLLSEVGNTINTYTYSKGNQAYRGSITWEHYDFSQSEATPKAQILQLVGALAVADPVNWGWGVKDQNYFPSLPDVDLDHHVVKGVPKVDQTPYTHHH